MYQSISQRFRRKNSNDLIVTFLPVVVVLTLHSYLRNADLTPRCSAFYRSQPSCFWPRCWLL